MVKELISGNESAAWGARLSSVQVFPNFPITPQTQIIEVLAKWKAEGKWDGEWVNMESEHSAISAAISSEATGARTFTATSSQGLLLMHEMLYVASGMRLPIVMANCSRGISAPITLWSDHNDIMSMRNSGWLMFFAKNNQEVVDSIIQAYKISEDKRVMLPSVVNLGGFILSFTNEPTDLPDQKLVNKFLGDYKPEPKTTLDVNDPVSLGVPCMEDYMYYKSQQHKAMINSVDVIKEVGKDFGKTFGRSYDTIEKYKTDDAKVIFVSLGELSTTLQSAVDSLRKQGTKAGLLRLRCFRPFPDDDIRKVLDDCEHVAVIDNNFSPGFGGNLYSDISTIVDHKRIANFIVGLGGKNVSRKDFEEMGLKTLKSKGKFWQV